MKMKRELRDQINNKAELQRRQLVPKPTLSAHFKFETAYCDKPAPGGIFLGDQSFHKDNMRDITQPSSEK